MADTRLPLTILGGFLGAGKTTWLRHQLHGGLSAHVLVNEAAGIAVDDALLAGASGLTVLPGGCVCCEGRAGLVAALRTLADRRSRGEVLADLILETSGLADPANILDTIAQDPVLVHHIRVVATVVLVDAAHAFHDAVAPLALHQMRAANQMILTKTDAVSPDRTARVLATLRALTPLTQISAAVAGLPVPLPAPSHPFDISQTDPRPLTATTIEVPAGADWAAVSLWLSGILHTHGDDLRRIKGVIPSPAGRLLIQTVRRSVQPPEVLPEGHGINNTLACIGQISDPSALQASLRRFLG